MDIAPQTYPSRTFIRFSAHSQLMADVTGQSITVLVQRLGGNVFTQEAIPGSEVPSLTANRDGFLEGLSGELPVNSLGLSPSRQTGSQAKLDPRRSPSGTGSPSDQATLPVGIDETLFQEIVKTTFNPNRWPTLYQSCGSEQAAIAVEAQVIAEIVAAYRTIKQKQDCPLVQGLNQLL